MLTSPCNLDPREPHLDVVKLGFSVVYIISSLSAFPGFALPVATVPKCEEEIFLAQKNFIWRKQVAKKNSPPNKLASLMKHRFGLFYAT